MEVVSKVADKLKSKPVFCDGPLTYLNDQKNEILSKHDALAADKAASVAAEVGVKTNDERDELTKALDKSASSLQSTYLWFNKEVLGEFAKIK